jgi:FAD/FMN-containing dehydrogenase
MTDLRVITSDGGNRILEEATVRDFAANLRGPLLRPADCGYDEARRVWNGMIDRRPALIAKCAGAADVIAAVRFAREQNLIFSIKGGGHNVTGNAVCEGGLVIDPSRMRSIRVDPVSLTVRAEAGVLGAEIDQETQAFGLSTPVGSVSSTGIGGLTLGGGQSWLGQQARLGDRQPPVGRHRDGGRKIAHR